MLLGADFGLINQACFSFMRINTENTKKLNLEYNIFSARKNKGYISCLSFRESWNS